MNHVSRVNTSKTESQSSYNMGRELMRKVRFPWSWKTHTQFSLLPYDFSEQSSLAKNRLKICCSCQSAAQSERKINSYQNNFKACYICLKIIKFSSFPFIFCSFSVSPTLQADLKDLSRRLLHIILIRQWCAFENNSKHADLENVPTRAILSVTASRKEQLE